MDPPPEHCPPNERLEPFLGCHIICKKNEYFNYITHVCDKCKEDEINDEFDRICKSKCKSDEIYNFEKKKCEIQPDCLNDEIFNPENKKCEKIINHNCKENEVYDHIDKKCSRIKEERIIISITDERDHSIESGEENIINNNEDDINEIIEYVDDSNFNENEERECPNNLKWDDRKKKCLLYKKCYNYKVWDPHKRKCRKPQYEKDCKKDEVYSIAQEICEKKSICKNGKLIDGVCVCFKNTRLINSICVKDNCKNGIIKNKKCICRRGKKEKKW
jgi:hypothetical protein